jgi:DNA adenine methylase
MRYLGGKQKIAKETAAAILKHTPNRSVCVEPFVGGGSMTAALSSHFELSIARDTHEDLILMWQALQNGWIPPDDITEEAYQVLRHSAPSALRAFAGFGLSFSGKWFGGYARDTAGYRDYCGAAKRGLLKKLQACKNVLYIQGSYSEAFVQPSWVVYCDPPYTGTTGYKDAFDSEKFWVKADQWVDMGADVFVSEYKAPKHWTPIGQKTRNRAMRSGEEVKKVTECLFMREDKACV